MTDPNEKKEVSPNPLNVKEGYELYFAIKELSKEFKKSIIEIKNAIIAGAKIKKFNCDRTKILNFAREKLKKKE